MQVAIFDMDGTLIDSMPGLTNLAVEVIRQHFYLNAGLARHEYLKTVGRPFSEQLEVLFPGPEARPSRVVADSVYQKRKRDITLEAPVFPEVTNKLLWHHNQGHTNVLVSSTTSSLVREVIVAKSISSFFDCVYGYTYQDKEAQIYEFLAHNQPSDQSLTAVYYGDSDEDLRLAKIFGFDFVRVTRDGRME